MHAYSLTFIFLITIIHCPWLSSKEEEAREYPTAPLYQVKANLKPKGLNGISDEQINDHWKLYEGYVATVNQLNAELGKALAEHQQAKPAYSALRRRYSFEYNGMILHELYFENLYETKKPDLTAGNLYDALVEAFGSYHAWKLDFISTALSRGIGWAILYRDPQTGHLINVFVSDHEIGHIACYQPLLVMDVWEHAYMVDHYASGRKEYIAAFMDNINWPIVEKRFNAGTHHLAVMHHNEDII